MTVDSGDSSRWDALPGGDSDSSDAEDTLAAPCATRGAIGSLSSRGDDTSAGAGSAAVRPTPDGAALAVTLSDSLTLTIAHDPAAGLAHRVWPSSLALAAKASAEECGKAGRPLFALELGCGPGLAGAAWAAAGARVVLTDLQPALPLAERSIALNGLADRATVARLGWGEPGGPALAAVAAARAGWWRGSDGGDIPSTPDLLLAADVVYDPALFAPLVETLSQFGRAGTRRVLLAHVRRWKSDARFWKAARREWAVRDVTETAGDGGSPARRSSSHERGAQRVFELTWKKAG